MVMSLARVFVKTEVPLVVLEKPGQASTLSLSREPARTV